MRLRRSSARLYSDPGAAAIAACMKKSPETRPREGKDIGGGGGTTLTREGVSPAAFAVEEFVRPPEVGNFDEFDINVRYSSRPNEGP